jgi:hypothetical protein
MSAKLTAPPVLKAGDDFKWWTTAFQSHLLLQGELRPLMKGKTLRAPDDPAIDGLENRDMLEAVLFATLVRAADNQGTKNELMWSLISKCQNGEREGTTAFAALRAFYDPTKMSGAFALYQRYLAATIAHGETAVDFAARLDGMRAEVLAAAPDKSQEYFGREMGPLSKLAKLMAALQVVADEKECDEFRRGVYKDMDDGVIVGAQGDFEKVNSSLFALVTRVKIEAETVLDGQRAAAFGIRGAPERKEKPREDRRRCFNCGEVGHVANACPKDRVTCDKCGVRGHQSAYCRERSERGDRRGGGVQQPPKAIAFMVRPKMSYMDALLGHAPPVEVEEDVARAAKVCRAGGSCDSEPELYLDTCATQHVFRDVSLFRGAMRKCGPVEVANKELAAAEGVGRAVAVLRDVDDQEYEVSFEEVRCCANFSANLVSWPQLRQKGFVLLENAEGLRHPSGVVFPLVPSALGPRFVVARGGPRGAAAMAVRGAPVVETGADREMRLWHERTGHLHERGLRELSTKGVATGVNLGPKAQLQVCDSCSVMKSHRVPLKFGIKQTQAGKVRQALPVTSYEATKQRPRGEVHYCDFFGPVRPTAIGGFPIMVGLAHGRTGVVKVEPLRKKSGLVGVLQRYNANVMPIKALRTDNEAVNKSQEVQDWCARENIQLSHCAPYTPEQLAKVERMWRTLGEGACAMLHASGLPDEFWAFAVDDMAYTYNRTHRASNEDGVSPMQAYTGLVPDLGHLRVFGCRAYLHVPKERRAKMQPKAKKGIFVGYSPQSLSYRVWVPYDENDVLRGVLYESRDVTFDEAWRYKAPVRAPAADEVEDDESEEEDEAEDLGTGGGAWGAGDVDGTGGLEDAGEPSVEVEGAGDPAGGSGEALRRSDRRGRGQTREWWKVEPAPCEDDVVEPAAEEAMGDAMGEAVAFAVRVSDPNAPSLRDALAGPEREQYVACIKKERESVTERGVFTCIPESEVPAGAALLTSEYIVRKKLLADGSIDKYKGRLVVHGNRQKAGRDYDPGDLFAPVARFTSLRVLVAMAAGNGWRLRQFDVETAFLYADLDEEIYVRPPREFPEYVNGTGGERVVWKLHKSLYGLRQAPRNWFKTFVGFLVDYGFKKSLRDPCVFVYTDDTTGELRGVFVLHVDDVPNGVAGEDGWYDTFLRAMKERFNFKEGPLEWCLGVEVVVEPDSVILRQSKYVRDVLERFGMQDCKPAN